MYSVQPIILAGGAGSRLWPLSRELCPKQFMRLTSSLSLLQTTIVRVVKLSGMLPPVVIVDEEYRSIAKNQIDELEIDQDFTILLEPLERNTAPAICGAVEYLHLHSIISENDVLLVLPCDHLIAKENAFQTAVKQAVDLAGHGRIVTFGIKPEKPEIGYGYIEKGKGSNVISFKEKPAVESARKYVKSGKYFWNSGMFAFSIKTFRGEMAKHSPGILSAMADSIQCGRSGDNFFRFDQGAMESVQNASIDYALMEKTDCIAVVTANLGWVDIGSWQALWEVQGQDCAGNVCQGDVVLEDTRNCLVRSEGRLVAAVGLEDTLVVETADAVLVASMSSSQKVKNVVEVLKKKQRKEFRCQRTVCLPWGSYAVFEKQRGCQVKKIIVDPGAKLSLHKHLQGHWVVVAGTAKVTGEGESYLLYENQSTFVPAGMMHKLENPGVIPLELIAVQIGSYLDEGGVVGSEDDCSGGKI